MATAPIKRGDDSPQLQSQTFTSDWRSGGSTVETWRAMSQSKMTTLWNGRIYTCKSAKMTFKQDMAEAEFTYADTRGGGGGGTTGKVVTQDRWEFPEPIEQKDILSHPDFLYDVTNFGASPLADDALFDVIAIMRRTIDATKNSQSSTSIIGATKDAVNKYFVETLGVSVPTWGYDDFKIVNFLKKYIQDQTHYENYQWAIRHTTRTPAYWNDNYADYNNGKIHLQADLLAELTSGALWNFPLPGRLQYKAGVVYSQFTAINRVRANHQIGWLKSASPESAVGDGSVEIQTTYKLDNWPVFVYPLR